MIFTGDNIEEFLEFVRIKHYPDAVLSEFTLHGNEFGTIDYYFEASVKSLTNSNHE